MRKKVIKAWMVVHSVTGAIAKENSYLVISDDKEEAKALVYEKGEIAIRGTITYTLPKKGKRT